MFFALPAKPTNIDSLKIALSNSKIISEQRAQTLAEISYAYFRQGEFDSVLVYGTKGYQLAKQLDMPKEMYNTANDVMIVNLEKNQMPKNTVFFLDFENLYKNEKISADQYSRILYLECMTGNLLEDVDALQESVKKLEEVQPKVSEKKRTKTQGYIYYFGARFSALEGKFERADTLLHKRLELNREAADSQGMAASYFDLALLHTESTKLYEKALDHAKDGLEITQAINSKYYGERLQSLQFFAQVESGFYELASTKLDSMTTLAEKADLPIFSGRIYLSIGDFYHKTKNYIRAEEFYLKSEEILKGDLNDPMIMLVYKGLAENYVAMDSFELAYNYKDKALVLTDTIHQEELKDIIDYNRTQISLKDQENENLQLENKIKISYFLIGFAIFFGLVLLYIVWQKIRSNRKLEKLNQRLADEKEKLAKAHEHLEFFSRSIYHDITSRINLILSFSELKKSSVLSQNQEGEMDDFSQLIYKNAVFLKQFVQDVRTFSRLEQNGTPTKEIDLNSVVSLVLETFGGQIYEKNAVLNIPDLPIIIGHETPIIQLFQNLTENAIKYTRTDAEPLINIDFKETEEHYKFSFENNGSPIPADLAKRIFEPFYRIKKKNVNGSGLGLAICKRIVDYYGGQLWLEKSDETSTIFSFTLPKQLEESIA
jgi:signal transduction histidine kinase